MLLKGKLNETQLQDLDALILRLKSLNRCNINISESPSRKERKRNADEEENLFSDLSEMVKNDKISIADIRPLPGDENRRLWEYISHCCKLATMTSKSQDKLKELCRYDCRLDIHDLVKDAVNDMVLHVYRYVWRKYEHSDDAGYVMMTAYFGFKTWYNAQVKKQNFDRNTLDLFESNKGEVFQVSKKKTTISTN